jgi:hypothetical protein
MRDFFATSIDLMIRVIGAGLLPSTKKTTKTLYPFPGPLPAGEVAGSFGCRPGLLGDKG